MSNPRYFTGTNEVIQYFDEMQYAIESWPQGRWVIVGEHHYRLIGTEAIEHQIIRFRTKRPLPESEPSSSEVEKIKKAIKRLFSDRGVISEVQLYEIFEAIDFVTKPTTQATAMQEKIPMKNTIPQEEIDANTHMLKAIPERVICSIESER